MPKTEGTTHIIKNIWKSGKKWKVCKSLIFSFLHTQELRKKKNTFEVIDITGLPSF
jgi:hypothetical protein